MGESGCAKQLGWGSRSNRYHALGRAPSSASPSPTAPHPCSFLSRFSVQPSTYPATAGGGDTSALQFPYLLYQRQTIHALHRAIVLVYNLIMDEESGNVERSFDAASIEVDARAQTSALQPCLCQTWGHDSARKSGVSMHREGFELGVILEGRMRLYLGEHSRLHLPGDVWMVGMWEPHRWQAAPKTRTLCVLFPPEFITEEVLPGSHWQPMFTCPPQDRPAVSESETRRVVLGIAREIADEAEHKRPQWSTVVRLCLAKLLVILGRCWQPNDVNGVADAQTPVTFDRIMPALAAIRSRPAQRLSLAQAAADCGLSTAQFSRVFARTMGLSFGRFRTRAHLSYAASLLLETGLSIDVVAARAGFTDASHLHRLFVKHYEATPGEFRHEFR